MSLLCLPHASYIGGHTPNRPIHLIQFFIHLIVTHRCNPPICVHTTHRSFKEWANLCRFPQKIWPSFYRFLSMRSHTNSKFPTKSLYSTHYFTSPIGRSKSGQAKNPYISYILPTPRSTDGNGKPIYQTSLRQWNVSIPTTLATIIGICKTISSIVVKISFGIHLKRLLIFFSVSMYAANIASPI